MATMISTIIIPVLNQYQLLDRAIASIPPGPNILIIDNGDTLDQAAVERGRVLRMPTNLGVATSWNLGIKAYPREAGWLLLNSDAHFATPADWETLCNEADPANIVLAGDPGWCCAWIGADVVRRVGLFCERYYPAYMEDVDYQQRAELHGISITHSHANIGHDNSSTIHADPAIFAENQRTHTANRAYHDYRWARTETDGLPSTSEWDLATRLANEWRV
jgi:GT2 family glycosyltransferase